MLVKNSIIRTKVTRPGMLVCDVYAECGRAHVQALPFVDETGKLSGRVTLKNIMELACLPDYMVAAAPLLGDFLSCVDNAQAKIEEVLASKVDPYVRGLHASIGPDEPAIKALAIMEQNDTSYLFVVDDGEYQGIITIQGIAEEMSKMYANAQHPG